jgi:hypothetical protein
MVPEIWLSAIEKYVNAVKEAMLLGIDPTRRFALRPKDWSRTRWPMDEGKDPNRQLAENVSLVRLVNEATADGITPLNCVGGVMATTTPPEQLIPANLHFTTLTVAQDQPLNVPIFEDAMKEQKKDSSACPYKTSHWR